MRNIGLAAALAAALMLCPRGAGTEARAEHNRRTPIVEAVQKTRNCIVTVKVQKDSTYSRTRDTTGTGIIVDERGFIITNRHVIQNNVRITVSLYNGDSHAAEVFADIPDTDLAILRIRTKGKLQALLLAPASDVMVGETVIAVGHPYGYRNTVSTGIISAVGREIKMPSGAVLTGLLQTNASINPGNSGGPLLNINGELIGVNTAIRDGAQGIAFAINSDTIKKILTRYLSASRLAGVRHGLACRESVAEEGKDRQHVVVADVNEGTPAADAGIRRGDEILKVDAKAVTNRFDLERALWDKRPGQKIELKVVRNGQVLLVPLTLSGNHQGETVARRDEN